MNRSHALRCAAGVLAGATFTTAYVCRGLEVPLPAVLGVFAFFVAVGAAAIQFIGDMS